MKPGAVAASGGGAVAFEWEREPGVSKLQSLKAAGEAATKPPPPAVEEEGAGERAAAVTKKEAVPHRIRVRPPPGAPGRGGRRGRAVVRRPEEDPFLAAFLACTERGKKAPPKGGQRLLGLGLGSGLGLSCKGPGDAVQSVVRLAKMAQASPER